jgi:hypothetical protein
VNFQNPQNENVKITVTDLSGKILEQSYTAQSSHAINCQGFVTGIYIVTVQAASYTESIKLILE